MRVTVARAGRLHASGMAELLNEVINEGGTTALTEPVSGETIREWMGRPKSAWHVAEDEDGQVMGFQWINQVDYLPPEAAEIATFARVGSTGLGIGSRLMTETINAARELGYTWINANIRANNTGGLAYYQSRGFEDYGRIADYALSDGTRVDKILKRYDLT